MGSGASVVTSSVVFTSSLVERSSLEATASVVSNAPLDTCRKHKERGEGK